MTLENPIAAGLAPLFGGVEQVPSFLAATLGRTDLLEITDAQLAEEISRTDRYSGEKPVVQVDPVLWTLSLLHRYSPGNANPIAALARLIEDHGIHPLEKRLTCYQRLLEECDERMLAPQKGATLVQGGIVAGFPEFLTPAIFQDMRDRTYRKIDTFAEEGLAAMEASANRIVAMLEFGVKYFADAVEYQGEEHIPETGRVVVACTHPFPMVDDFSLMLYFIHRFPDRPWFFLANTNTISHYYPNWRQDPSFTSHMMGLEREEGRSHGPVLNGQEAVEKSAQFLQDHEDGLFFIAPEGPDAVNQNRLAHPHHGFAKIAFGGGAQILPVVHQGQADLNTLTYDVQGQFLEPFRPTSSARENVEEWIRRVTGSYCP